MSRDANGTFNLAAGNPVVPATKIRVSWANPTLSDIAAGLTDSLSRSGKGAMGAALAMGGFKINALAAALLATDAPQATQVRDQAFTWLNPIFSESTGNDYTGTALLQTAPNNGTSYQFLADRDNTGPMTLSVNGGASLPVLIHGAPTPAGLILAGAVLEVTYVNLTYRLVSVSQSGGTINSIASDTPQAITVDNDFGTGIATLNLHTNVANGLCKLDGSTKVPVVQLPFTDIHYVGIWNAAPGTNPGTTGIVNGDFYIITVAGNLTIFRVSVGNVYTAQVTAVGVGDAIIRRVGSTDLNQPDGWYYDPAAASPAVASTVSMTPTPTLPAVTDVQTWMDQMDPIIDAKLPLAGGTLSGAVFQPVSPSTGPELANRQYVDDAVASLVGVLSFNMRTGAVTLTALDVTDALAFTPANKAGDTFTGAIAGTTAAFSGNVGAKSFTPTVYTANLTATPTIDFANGQSQELTLTTNAVIAAINNVPIGGILRLTLLVTTFTVTWPANVFWPLGVSPSLGAGPLDKAIVVLEKITSGDLLATASVY
jgi:hypothetical protein